MGFIILGLITTIYIVVAYLSYSRNPRNITNRLFSLFTLLIAVWSLSSFLEDEPLNLLVNNILLRADFALGILLSYIFLLFTLFFPKRLDPIPRKFVYFSSFITFLLFFSASFTELISANIYFDDGIRFTEGILFYPYAFSLALNFLVGVFILLKKYRHFQGLEKLQTLYLFFGVILSVIIALAFNVVMFSLLDVPPQTSRFGIYGTLVMIVAIAYSIVKHRLLDIQIIIRRSLIYSVLLSILVGLYSLLVFGLNRIFLPEGTTTFPRVTDIIAIIIVAFTIDPLKRIIEQATDKIFFKARYNAEETIKELSERLVSEIDITHLVRKIKDVLTETIKASKISIYMRVDHRFSPIAIANDFPEKLETGIEKRHFLTEYLSKKPEILIVDEVKRIIQEGKRVDEGLEQAIKVFDKNGVAVVLPLLLKGKLTGAIFLGEKLSQDIYSSIDIRFLEILSHQAALSLENTRLYEEQKLYGVRLTREVERATADLRNANERLKELDKLKDEFMSIASHELRTPMTAIKSYVWLALHGKTQEKDPKVRDYLNKVYDSSERMISMINDMLNVSRIETGKIQLEITPVSIYKAAEQVKEDLSAKAAEAGVKVIVNKETVVPNVLADRDKLIEIFTNLIGNALKFTKKGGSVSVNARKTGNMVEVSVTDTGVGIAKENITKLFKKYGKLNESYATVSSTTGTGLGLYITKQYLEKMNGYIKVKSDLGKGTTFTFALPIASGKEMAKEQDEEKPVGIVFNPEFLKESEASQDITERQKPS